MQTPKSSDVLALCHQLFPGLTWTVRQDSDDLAVQYQSYSAHIDKWDVQFELVIQHNGAMAGFGFRRLQLMRSLNEGGQTCQQALTNANLGWVDYCADMSKVLCAQSEGGSDEIQK